MDIQQWEKEIPGNRIRGKTLLVGVSGGSDSMALLNALLRLQTKIDFQIAVAHINHHLRVESQQEEDFVTNYCQQRQLPVFIGHWQPTTTHVEEEARTFRYSFFDQIMKQEHYDILCTAHHQNDRIETALRRIVSGYHVWDIDGLVTWQKRGNYWLWRPFLSWSKEEILQWCQSETIPFMEDPSNQSLHYERNRIRHQWLPVLRQENPKFDDSFIRFLNQLALENQTVQRKSQRQLMARFDSQKQEWDIHHWQKELTWALCRYLMQHYSVEMTQQKAIDLDCFLRKIEGTKRWQLNSHYYLEKVYGKIRVLCVETVEKQEQDVYTLIVNEGLFLSENEWIGLYDRPPKSVNDRQWKSVCWRIPAVVPLIVRHVQNNDRFIFNRYGQTKKVRRFFIDQKIPHSQRENCWVISDEMKRIYGILPWRQSYLSNDEETDKMNYIIYYYRING